MSTKKHQYIKNWKNKKNLPILNAEIIPIKITQQDKGTDIEKFTINCFITNNIMINNIAPINISLHPEDYDILLNKIIKTILIKKPIKVKTVVQKTRKKVYVDGKIIKNKIGNTVHTELFIFILKDIYK